jgi:thiamine pyrophosphate-dependent acetolactate synthase large subunit-like protein
MVDKVRKTEQYKIWYEKNKVKKLEYSKEYYEENKEKRREQQKIIYEINKVEIKEKNKEKLICECGKFLTFGALIRHKKTNKHLIFKNQN